MGAQEKNRKHDYQLHTRTVGVTSSSDETMQSERLAGLSKPNQAKTDYQTIKHEKFLLFLIFFVLVNETTKHIVLRKTKYLQNLCYRLVKLVFWIDGKLIGLLKWSSITKAHLRIQVNSTEKNIRINTGLNLCEHFAFISSIRFDWFF